MDITNKQLNKILKKLCKTVKADIDDIEFRKSDWYYDYEWTREEEEKFEKWLVKFLIKKCGYKNRLYAESEAGMFVLSYGWKIRS